ncbi:MAG: CD225/dispanin family protein [Planctomycetes bacterium]|nr:CD225/dispanin family protein [Planctomycetota bacterium]
MFCRSCGEQIADEAVMCPKCGTSVIARTAQTDNATAIPNHLVGAILATIFCCMPFGVPAIVYAAQVNSRIAAGDLEGAMKASKNAKMWMLISVSLGVFVCLFYTVAAIVKASSES